MYPGVFHELRHFKVNSADVHLRSEMQLLPPFGCGIADTPCSVLFSYNWSTFALLHLETVVECAILVSELKAEQQPST